MKRPNSAEYTAYRDMRQVAREEKAKGRITLPAVIRQPETQPIFKKDKRRHLIEDVMNMFGDWRLSRFEREASVRTGLRSELCLSGYDWKRSDDEAAVIVAEAFRLLGAARPSWQEGQWEYTISRDYCAWCHSPIDDEDRTDGQRFCSPHCARCSLEWRARSERGESKAIVQAARALINRRSRPARLKFVACQVCAEVGTKFVPTSPPHRRATSRPLYSIAR